MTNNKFIWVVKVGGNVIDHEQFLYSFLEKIANTNQKIVLIHGGGKLATELSKKLQIETQMVNGRRITDKETLKVVTMVYAGLINKNIVAQLQSFGKNAIGLSGADANLIEAHKRITQDIDYGFVGDIDRVNSSFLSDLIDKNILPVIAPITHDKKGNLLNTNADTMAGEIAVALAQEGHTVNLLYCFEKKGLLLNVEDENSVIDILRLDEIEKLKKDGNIHSGMIPKIDNCTHAIKNGVAKVIIGHADEVEKILTDEKTGTQLIA